MVWTLKGRVKWDRYTVTVWQVGYAAPNSARRQSLSASSRGPTKTTSWLHCPCFENCSCRNPPVSLGAVRRFERSLWEVSSVNLSQAISIQALEPYQDGGATSGLWRHAVNFEGAFFFSIADAILSFMCGLLRWIRWYTMRSIKFFHHPTSIFFSLWNHMCSLSLSAVLCSNVCDATETSGQKCLVSTSMSLSLDLVCVCPPQRRNTLSQVFLISPKHTI